MHEDENILSKLRHKRTQYEDILKQIENLDTRCYAYNSELKFEQEKLNALKSEIAFRKLNKNELENQYNSLQSNGEDNTLLAMKTKFIAQNLNRQILEKIPEIQTILNSQNNEETDVLESEFFNPVFDHVKLFYTVYSQNNPYQKCKSDDDKSFKISKKSTFAILKSQACLYWGIQDEKEFVITDDCESYIYNENICINSYLRDYSVSNNMFRMISINTLKARNKLFPLQEQRFKENKLMAKQKPKEKKKYELTADRSATEIAKFKYDFLGLRHYLLIEDDSIIRTINPQDQARNIETSFYMLFILLLFFILTIMFLFNTRSIWLNNIRIDYLSQTFNNIGVRDYKTLYKYLFEIIALHLLNNAKNRNIINSTDCFMNKTLLNKTFLYDNFANVFSNDKKFFYEENGCIKASYLTSYMDGLKSSIDFFPVSSIHFIYNKVKEINCMNTDNLSKIIVKTDVCYEEYYDESQAKTNIVLKDSLKSLTRFAQYKTSKEAGMKFSYETRTGTYYGSGFHFDIIGNTTIFDFARIFDLLIPINPKFHVPTSIPDEIKNINNDLSDYLISGNDVRNLAILFTVYFPNEYNWASIAINFDYLPTGIISPGETIIKIFKPNIYEDSPGLIIGDVIRLIISFIFIYFVFLEVLEKINDLTKAFNPKMVFTLIMVICYCYSFFIKIIYLYSNNSYYYDSNMEKYIDTLSMGDMFNTCYYIESLILGVVLIKIFSFFKLIIRFKLFYIALEDGFQIFSVYMIFLTVIMLMFASIAHILWGPYLRNFSVFFYAFIQVLLFSLGIIDTEVLLYFNLEWTILFMIGFYSFALFFVFSICTALYSESLRKTTIREGYPEENLDSVEWKLRDYVTWLCYFIKK